MELCPGGSLADRLADGQRLSPDELIPTLVSIADGLADLHARGVVHRDVKPSNILFASDRAKLADFGLARADGAEPDELTTPGTAVGTMAYLAPEVLSGRTATGAADIYALGVAAFVGLTGKLPRPATSLAALIAASRKEPASLSDTAPDLGGTFDEPIAAALAADPARRPDALDFASSMTAALGAWGRSRPPLAPIPTWTPDTDSGADATTAMSVPPDGTTPPAVPTVPVPADPAPERHEQSSRRWRAPAAVAVAAILAALALWGVLNSLSGTGSSTPVASSAPSESAAPSASDGPSASPSQAAPPAVADPALAALDEVDAAISATTGKGGLKGKERNELERRAREVRSALADGDREKARASAEALAEEVEGVRDELDEQRARRLTVAVSTLVDILNGAD